jgi:hypothetical protein
MYVVREDEVSGPRRILPILEAVSVNRHFPPGVEMPFVTRRGDVQALTCLKVHAGSGEVKLQPALVPVPHPENVVAVRLQPGKGVTFEALDDLLLHVSGNALTLLFLEGENSVCVSLVKVQRVDDSSRAAGIAAHDLRVHIPLFFEKVVHEATPTCSASPKGNKFHDHEAASSCPLLTSEASRALRPSSTCRSARHTCKASAASL